MSTLVTLCGFCNSRDQTFDIVSHELTGNGIFVLGLRCRKCRRVSCALATSPTHDNHAAHQLLSREADATSAMRIREQTPLPHEPKAPKFVPTEVAKAFVQAEKLVGSPDMPEPAAVMYGRTVEIALSEASKIRGVALSGATLVKRIDDAAEKALLPKDLAEWSHEVRQLRNEGAHGVSVAHDEVLELQGFVELLLRYLFTLPGLMQERRLKKEPLSETL
jgi:hypothetical protein